MTITVDDIRMRHAEGFYCANECAPAIAFLLMNDRRLWDENAVLRARIAVLEKVAEAAHKHRVTVMLSIHDASDVLSRKEMDDICRTDEALKAALDALKQGKGLTKNYHSSNTSRKPLRSPR